MSLYSLNKDMLIQLVTTIQDDMKKRYEGYHEFKSDKIENNINYNDRDLYENLKDTFYFVEADRFSVHALWVMYVDRPYKGCQKAQWEQIYTGYYEQFGNTTINFNFNIIYGKLVCFYYPTSNKIDWNDVGLFLSQHCKRNRTNASNFHNCLLACKE